MKSFRDQPLFTYMCHLRGGTVQVRHRKPGLDLISFVYTPLPLPFNFIVPRVVGSEATKPYYEFHASRVKGLAPPVP